MKRGESLFTFKCKKCGNINKLPMQKVNWQLIYSEYDYEEVDSIGIWALCSCSEEYYIELFWEGQP